MYILKVGLAVGTAEKAHKDAEFKEIEFKVSCYDTKETVQLSNNNNTLHFKLPLIHFVLSGQLHYSCGITGYLAVSL